MKRQQSIYGEMKVELQRRQAAEREARERARQMRAGSQDRTRDSADEKAVQQVSYSFIFYSQLVLGTKFVQAVQ